ncbi:ribosome-associated translation inhibitor RaiA [Candidatus Saccharibacteria bacterium]|jgi:putative sigma-54 modulation protein|nr:ribosome-associated translation inhibitor RaiA [Candidatus Saccharibacteria bacterium]
MIEALTITGIKYEVDDKSKKYIRKKIGALDKYLPRHARKTAKADVKVEQIDRRDGNKYEVEVILTVPNKTITAKDSTLNVLAAVDIVESKLANQLRKYKETRLAHVGKKGLMARFKRSFAREQQ